jgi:hypothetical protein
MDEVASSAAKPSAADRKAMANRLELPAMPALAAHPPGKPSSKGLGALQLTARPGDGLHVGHVGIVIQVRVMILSRPRGHQALTPPALFGILRAALR